MVNNGIKFTPNGGLITINASKHNDFVELTFSDTGVGMDKDTISKLFKVDECKSTLGTNKEKGTGLGLVLCKEFVERNGGKIEVISQLGKGSEFKIELPAINWDI